MLATRSCWEAVFSYGNCWPSCDASFSSGMGIRPHRDTPHASRPAPNIQQGFLTRHLGRFAVLLVKRTRNSILFDELARPPGALLSRSFELGAPVSSYATVDCGPFSVCYRSQPTLKYLSVDALWHLRVPFRVPTLPAAHVVEHAHVVAPGCTGAAHLR